MVGLNSSDTLFDTLEETGGSKDAVVVSHNHTTTSTVTDAGHSHGTTIGSNELGNGTIFVGGANPNGRTNTTNTATTGITVATTVNSSGVSGTNANVQPYITVNMWKRTA